MVYRVFNDLMMWGSQDDDVVTLVSKKKMMGAVWEGGGQSQTLADSADPRNQERSKSSLRVLYKRTSTAVPGQR